MTHWRSYIFLTSISNRILQAIAVSIAIISHLCSSKEFEFDLKKGI